MDGVKEEREENPDERNYNKRKRYGVKNEVLYFGFWYFSS